MNAWTAFILGLLIGWLIEWIIDWVYWRRKVNEVSAEFAASKSQVEKLRAESAIYPTRIEKLQADFSSNSKELEALKAEKLQLQADLASCSGKVEAWDAEKTHWQGEMQAKDAEIAELKARLGSMDGAARGSSLELPARDNLLELPGVDANIAQRLNLAGLLTFKDIGALSPLRLKEILGSAGAEAKQEVEIVKKARVAAGLLSKVDDLEIIVGIGPVIAKLLNLAGIFTFAELGKLNAEELRHIVGERIQRLADEDDLLAQARDLAAKQG